MVVALSAACLTPIVVLLAAICVKESSSRTRTASVILALLCPPVCFLGMVMIGLATTSWGH